MCSYATVSTIKRAVCPFHSVTDVTQILILAQLHHFHARESFGFKHKSVNVCLPTDRGSCFSYIRLKIDLIRLK